MAQSNADRQFLVDHDKTQYYRPTMPRTAKYKRSKGRGKVTRKTQLGRKGLCEGPPAARTRSSNVTSCHHPPTKRLRRESPPTTKPRNKRCKSQMIKCLPNHIISNILFDYLAQSPRQLSTIRRVCTLFRSMARDSFTALDLRLDITRETNPGLPNSFNMLIGQFTNLREVDFSFCDNFDDSHLKLLEPMRCKLRMLKLRGTRISDQGVLSFFDYDKCMKLTQKQESSIAATDSPPPSLPLEVLDLSETKPCVNNSSRVTDKSLLAVMYTCHELKLLSLSMCRGITDNFLESIPTYLTKLTVLDVAMTSITSRGCSYLARLPSLREVDISACEGLCGQAIIALVTGKSPICEEGVNVMDDDEYNIMQRVGLARGKGSASQLTSIAARYAKGIDTNILDALAVQAPKLQTLDLRHYQGNDLEIGKIGVLSAVKMSLRKLKSNGVEVAFSRLQCSID